MTTKASFVKPQEKEKASDVAATTLGQFLVERAMILSSQQQNVLTPELLHALASLGTNTKSYFDFNWFPFRVKLDNNNTLFVIEAYGPNDVHNRKCLDLDDERRIFHTVNDPENKVPQKVLYDGHPSVEWFSCTDPSANVVKGFVLHRNVLHAEDVKPTPMSVLEDLMCQHVEIQRISQFLTGYEDPTKAAMTMRRWMQYETIWAALERLKAFEVKT